MSQEFARARYYSYWISVLIKFERKRDHRTQTDWRKERESTRAAETCTLSASKYKSLLVKRDKSQLGQCCWWLHRMETNKQTNKQMQPFLIEGIYIYSSGFREDESRLRHYITTTRLQYRCTSERARDSKNVTDSTSPWTLLHTGERGLLKTKIAQILTRSIASMQTYGRFSSMAKRGGTF
jgi:hypothetical protein